MFIVAMTLAIIAAMGVYALQIASAEVKTAGFIRQQVQTQYLAAYGVGATAQALTGPNAQVYNNLMTQSPDGNCFSLAGVAANTQANVLDRACHRSGSIELQTQMASTNQLVLPYSDSSTDVHRGSTGLGGPDFYVEVTDPNQRQPPAGYQTNSTLCFTQFTVSAFGLTPSLAMVNTSADVSSTDTASSDSARGFTTEGLQIARARVLSGPITCSGTN